MTVLDVTVTNNGVNGYWIAIDESDVNIVNNAGQTQDLAAGVHTLVWWMVGSPGASIGIDLKNAGAEVTSVQSSMIPPSPPGNTHGAGFKRFTL